MQRRSLLIGLSFTAAVPAWPVLAQVATLPNIEVFKSPYCDCCGAWVDHLRRAGFAVKVTSVDDTAAARKRLGMPDDFGSCHSASVAGYALEGHVPAAEVRKLLALRPAAIGLAVPGMPVGSPGMEVGSRRDAYQVFLIDRGGRSSVFASYPKG